MAKIKKLKKKKSKGIELDFGNGKKLKKKDKKLKKLKGGKTEKSDKKLKKKGKKSKSDGSSSSVKPIKDKMNRSQLANHFGDALLDAGVLSVSKDGEVKPKTIRTAGMTAVTTLENAIVGSLHAKGVGEFQLPGFLKLATKKKPATKGGEKRKNPFKPGTFIITKAKPASLAVRARPLKKLKDAVADSF